MSTNVKKIFVRRSGSPVVVPNLLLEKHILHPHIPQTDNSAIALSMSRRNPINTVYKSVNSLVHAEIVDPGIEVHHQRLVLMSSEPVGTFCVKYDEDYDEWTATYIGKRYALFKSKSPYHCLYSTRLISPNKFEFINY